MKWFIKCFKQYCDFKSRASRKELWMFILFYALFSFVFLFLDFGIFGDSEIFLCTIIYWILTILPSLAVEIRRFHDINKSGWNILWLLIPILGAILVLVWFCKKGNTQSNQYGDVPVRD